MADFISDKKLTQDEADRLQAPMKIDLISLFKVIEEDLINMVEDFEGSPDALINSLTGIFQNQGPDEIIGKSQFYEKVISFCKYKLGENNESGI
jgi:hypothetical protein